MQHQHIAVAV